RGAKLRALADIDLEIHPGEFFVLVGPSGSGKSTLLRIMSGLEKTFTGSVEFGEGFSRDSVSFVFQQFALLPWLTVRENIEMGLNRQPLAARRPRSTIEMERLGLTKFANAYPHELSGGQRQRVGIARALATDPKIIFMDEPLSELDSFTAEELRKEILQIWHERKPTIIMVTHIIEDAVELADRIAVMTRQPGQIEKVIHNPLERPRVKRSEGFYRLEDELRRLIKPE
ncbi:MAG TPA: ABC transporter ATP-binding protein, partial [Candidatus Paceibacterota bacterium]|nr:ABC transporter ATP-binding protein [Candidatus Paceibacterota bacterium]